MADDDVSLASGSRGDDSIKPGRYVDRYKVLFPLGQGGRGHVFVAYDPHLDRKIALKVLRRRDPDGCEELVAEAQNIARLDHPNVVEVLAVGEHGGRLFMAMEFIEGCTLAQWLRRERREWPEIIDAFIAAGRGLEAAHGVGFVHRDFKPQNVMVARDGRIRVLDFGMALERSQTLTSTDTSRRSARSRFSGTVAYMAPEQFLGEPLDERTDQFSFCVSLYEALWGYAPFPGTGDSVRERAKAVVNGELRRPPRRGPVPARVRRAVLRGLRREPQRRWPSMAHLLRELTRARTRDSRLWPVYAVASTLVLGGVIMPLHEGDEGAECRTATVLGHELWGPQRQEQLAGVLEKQASAPFTAQRVVQKISDYATAWEGRFQALCLSRTEQAESLAYDHEMACLRRRGAELDAVVEALLSAEKIDLIVASESLSQLSPAQTCAHVAKDDERTSATAPEIAKRFDQINAYLRTAQFVRALEEAKATERLVASAETPRVHAEALFWLGMAEFHRGDFDRSLDTLARAHLAATATGDDRIAAISAVRALGIYIVNRGDLGQALTWSRHAEAAVGRLPADDELRSELLERQALLAQSRGEAAQADKLFNASIAALETAGERKSLQMARIHNNYGLFLAQQGALADALEHQTRALQLKRKHVGHEHPLLTSTMINIAFLSLHTGQRAEARTLLEEGLRIRLKAYGNEHPAVAAMHGQLGALYVELGSWARARESLEQAQKIYESMGGEPPGVESVLANLARCDIEDNRLEQATGQLYRVLDLTQRRFGAEDENLLPAYMMLGDVAAKQQDYPEAHAWYERAAGIVQRKNELHPAGIALHRALGRLLTTERRFEEAVEHYERALRAHTHHALDPISSSEMKLELADALENLPDRSDPERPRRLVAEILETPVPQDERWRELERSARRWLAYKGRR